MTYIFLFIIVNALGNIFIHTVGADIPNMLLMFLTTTYAILFFHCINFKTILSVYKKLFTMKLLFLSTMLTVAIMWMGTFYLSIEFTPAIQIFLFVGYTSLFGSFVNFLTMRKKKENTV